MNFASFDLNLLRVFDALIRERSVTRAGEDIGLSQPAVSNALARLRHHLSDELFVRRANDMVPAPKAEALADTIRKALADIERAIADEGPFRPQDLDQTFTFSGADYFSVLFMPRLYGAVAPVAPRVRFRMVESATVDIQSLLRDSVIDMSLERDVGPLPDWISSVPMMQSPFVVAAAKDNSEIMDARVKEGEALPLDLFCRLPHALRSADGTMSGVIDAALDKIGETRRVALALPHFHAVANAVAKSGLIAALPEQSAREAAASLPLALFKPPFELANQELRLYWHRRQDRSPPHRWMRAQVLEIARTLV